MENSRETVICKSDPNEDNYSLYYPFIPVDLAPVSASEVSKDTGRPKDAPVRAVTYCLKDAFALYQAKRRNNATRCKNEETNLDLLTYVHDYFDAVTKGAHVNGRDFEFITQTWYNKLSFVKLMHA